MSTWLEQLERELDKRLSEFLRNNPVPVSYTHLTLPTT